jgi:hypothetical protein
MQITGTWQTRGKMTRAAHMGRHIWWVEVLEPACVDGRAVRSAFVSQCKVMEALDPKPGEQLIVEAARCELDRDDVRQSTLLVFGVQQARRA